MTTATDTKTTVTIRDLQNLDRTLYVKNTSPHTLTCNVGKDNRFLLGKAGATDSVAILPKWVAEAPGFQRAWLRGDVVISDEPEMQHEIMFQAEQRTLAETARVADVQAVVEPSSASRSMVEKTCLVSGERVFQTEQEIKDLVPPLAERFKDRAHEFVATETFKDGETVLVWSNPTQGK